MSPRRTAAPAAHGMTAALRALATTLHEMAHVRGALLAVELREEIGRRRSMLWLAVAGIALVHMALVFFSVLVAAFFWDTHHRLGAIGAMAALYFAGGAAAFIKLRRAAIDSPAPFAASRRELAEDFAQLVAR